MSFATAAGPYLAMLTALCVSLGFVWAGRRRRRAVERMGPGAQLTRMTASHSTARYRAKAVMLTLAATLCAIAVARPQRPGESSWRRRGIDVVVVMDFSASMLAKDIRPNRLARMTREVEELIDRLGSDRVGVVVFAGAAAHFPLTHDHEAARSVFRGLAVGDLPPGSDLGAALRVARCIARPGIADDPGCSGVGGRGRGGDADGGDADGSRRTAQAKLADRARAVVVFTDGEDTEGNAGIEIAQAMLLGIHVYFVGVGTTQGELVPELDARGQEIGWKKTPDSNSFVTTRLAVDQLQALARLAGGADHLMVIDAQSRASAGDAIRARLDRLEQGDLDEHAVQRPRDIYHWFLFPAFLLLLIEACMSTRKARVHYPVNDVDPGPSRTPS